MAPTAGKHRSVARILKDIQDTRGTILQLLEVRAISIVELGLLTSQYAFCSLKSPATTKCQIVQSTTSLDVRFRAQAGSNVNQEDSHHLESVCR